ncbi:MAG TPA: hypothetical protein VH743_02960 [Beijerinckiaceae bacterium]|jgi:hypothetical protein
MPNASTSDKAPAGRDEAAGPALARPLQEHLGQQLRTTYTALTDKPAFLGDAAVPPQFEEHLQRLEAKDRERHHEKVRQRGIAAVENALQNLDVEPPERADR